MALLAITRSRFNTNNRTNLTERFNRVISVQRNQDFFFDISPHRTFYTFIFHFVSTSNEVEKSIFPLETRKSNEIMQ